MSALVCAALVSPAAIAAQPVERISLPHAADHVLVSYERGAGPAVRSAAAGAIQAVASERLSLAPGSPVRVMLRRGMSVEQALERLRSQPGVAVAEPDYIVHPADASNDPYFTNGALWGMYGDASSPANQYGSGAAEAWAAGYTGSHSVYVGVIDEGIQFSHPDLAANIWTNPYDPVDGIDNDANGYVDDAHGWDFYNNDASIYDGSSSAGFDDHGTHVSGTIGAQGGNGLGVAGVNWQVTIIATKFLGPDGGNVSDAIRALDYLTDLHTRHGLDIVATNNSWGGGSIDPLLQAAIERAGDAGMLFVAAAGNDSANNDNTASFPSNLSCANHADGTPRGYDCIVAVAATTSSGALASFSNYGATTVDLGAPGASIWSTVPVNSYAAYSGTSMATPHVTGALALCASIGGLRGADLRAALLNSVAATPSLAARTASGGRLDIGAMVGWCAPSTAPVSGGPSDLSANALGPHSVQLGWSDGAQNETAFEIQRAPGSAGGCGTFATLGQAPADATGYLADGLIPGSDYCFRLRASNSYQGGSTSDWSNTAGATTPPLPVYGCAPTSYAWMDAAGTGYALADDGQVRVNLPAGFAFDYYDTPATWIDISANGYLDVGTVNDPAQPWANTALPSADEPNGVVAAWWDDLNPAGATKVWTQTFGSAGSRLFVVEWLDVAPFASGSTSGVTFEVVLEEASGAITFAYKDVSAGLAAFDKGAGATVGLEDQDGTSATQISYNQPTLTASSAYRCSTDGSSAPDTTAPTAASPTATLFAPQTLGSTATLHLSWAPSADASGITGYDLQYSKAGGSWTSIGLSSPSATSVAFAVTPGKKYAFRLRAHDGAGNVGAWSTSTLKVNLVQEGAASVTYTGTFRLSYLSGASGGKVRRAGVAGRIARLTFSGSSVAFVTTLGPARGIVGVWLDGALVQTLDLYSSTLKTRRIFWAGATGAGTHMLEIRPTGTRNAASSSSRIDVDAFLVQL